MKVLFHMGTKKSSLKSLQLIKRLFWTSGQSLIPQLFILTLPLQNKKIQLVATNLPHTNQLMEKPKSSQNPKNKPLASFNPM